MSTTTVTKTTKEMKETFKVFGMPWYILAGVSLTVIFAAAKGFLPNNIVGGFALLYTVGILFGFIGDRIPIWNEYVGGGPILAFLGAAALVYWGVIPEKSVETVKLFMDTTDFLDLFISVLITGSILSVNRKLLMKAFLGYIPAIIGGIIAAFVFGILGGVVFGIPASEVATKYVLPIMGGGTGAGAIPMSEIYASVTGGDPAAWLSFALSILTIANIIAIFSASVLSKLGETKAGEKFNGHGELIRTADDISKLEEKVEIKVTAREVAVGLILSCAFYVLGNIFSKIIIIPEFTVFGTNVKIDIHRFAWMVILVAVANVANVIPLELKEGAKKLQGFFSKQFTIVVMVGVGIALTDLGELIAAFTFGNVVIAALIVFGAIVGSGLIGWLVGFYPIETAITAGLCMANRGGSGDVAVLTAAKRMDLMSFAQISSRLGGGLMLVIASILFGIFF
ncbi:2-hydroxycarboxylate transporter family protein [Clostridium sp. MSJ-11]|uniref:2-hydroxycarboxylate transporter family protein n=1 Tax=Clostridium mobile TaxID=2841512 RepID=A0ABS6EJN3_9CLOT|nr:2-hydroxycarboxylate transporter family protein [Clostridium mobile]MBU5485225.1 2-hydroxycarboxylate transporter family protein [Clostridium mobile]